MTLLSSTSSIGLQTLIDKANAYMTQIGLKFNSSKTSCMIFGDNPFTELPRWTLGGEQLEIKASVSYLGAVLSHKGGNFHCESRVSSARKAFYSLQGAGLRKDGVSPNTTAKEILNSTLTYACSSLHLTKSNLKDLDKLQSKLLKTVLGLKTQCRTTPLLRATDITPVSTVINASSLRLLKSCVFSNTQTRLFYTYLIGQHDIDSSGKTLYGRTLTYARENCINFINYIFNDKYNCVIDKQLKCTIAVWLGGLHSSCVK